MSFVAVYLLQARELVVVPDTWILDLNQAKLKNYGVNSNQDFLVFWSAQNGRAILDAEIDFEAFCAKEYHATVDSVCYKCRIKKFFGKYFRVFCCIYSGKSILNIFFYENFRSI